MKQWMLISILLLLSASQTTPRETLVHKVDIDVLLDDSGTAHITEVWDIDVHTGTEWYLVQGNLGTIEIHDLTVSDETNQTYINEGDWDTNRTIFEKAGRCGMVRKGHGSYEICWGTGSYGRHRFTVSYTMTNFVKRLSDSNAFNHQFVAEGLSSPPKRVRVVVQKISANDSTEAFTLENTNVWAFGFEGDIHVIDGKIVAQTRQALDEDRSVIVMARFDSDLFTPTDRRAESFEAMKKRAFESSDYKDDDEMTNNVGLTLIIGSCVLYFFYTLLNGSTWKRILYTALFSPVCMTVTYFGVKWWEYLLAGALALLIIGLVIYTILELVGITSSKPVYGVRRVKGWSRNIPLDGDPVAANYILNEAAPFWKQNKKHLIEALLLRFIYRGAIRISRSPDDKNPKLSFNAEMPSETEFSNHVEYKLYKIIRAASGKDLTLQPHEFSKWAREKDENGQRLLQWIKATKTHGEKTFDLNGGILKNRFTRRGRDMARTVPEFKNYLADFSIINERQAQEVALWDDYLVFASLFGIADKVEKDFKTLSPEYFHQKELVAQGYDRSMASIMARDISNRFISGSVSYKAKVFRASGGGGFSSLGGGGGHTGGGRGGGAR